MISHIVNIVKEEDLITKDYYNLYTMHLRNVLMPQLGHEHSYRTITWERCTQYFFNSKESAEDFAGHAAIVHYGSAIFISSVYQMCSASNPKVIYKSVTEKGILPIVKED